MRLRVLLSDSVLRFASLIPKQWRQLVKNLRFFRLLFEKIQNREFVERQALESLIKEQRKRLENLVSDDSRYHDHTLHLVIDARDANHNAIDVSLQSVMNQYATPARITILGLPDALRQYVFENWPEKHIEFVALFNREAIDAAVQDKEAGTLLLLLKAGGSLSQFSVAMYLKEFSSGKNFGAVYSDIVISEISKKHAQCRPAFCPDYLREYNYIPSAVAFQKKMLNINLLQQSDEALSVDAVNHTFLLGIDFDNHSVSHLPYFLLDDDVSYRSKSEEVSALAECIIEDLGGKRGYSVAKRKSSGVLRVDWEIPEPTPLVSIVIPTKDQVELLQQCIDSVLSKTSWKNYEILIVNNASKEPKTTQYLDKIASTKIRILEYPGVFNYSAINNFAVDRANGDYILLLNNDVEVISRDWLEAMLGHAARKDIACVGANLFYSDDTHQHAGVIVGYGGVAGHAHKHFSRGSPGYMNRLIVTQNYTAVTAACLLISKEIYYDVGGLDEDNLTVAFNDVDLCLKACAAGYRNVWLPHAELYHHESVSRGSDRKGAAKKRFLKEISYMKQRWNTDTVEDPAYNSNLTLRKEDFSLRTHVVNE